jgi:hypothetical protein
MDGMDLLGLIEIVLAVLLLVLCGIVLGSWYRVRRQARPDGSRPAASDHRQTRADHTRAGPEERDETEQCE